MEDLAGGDDKIFVVIDDRDDVWVKDSGVIQNLLKIPAYYYTKETHHFYLKQSYFERYLRQVG